MNKEFAPKLTELDKTLDKVFDNVFFFLEVNKKPLDKTFLKEGC